MLLANQVIQLDGSPSNRLDFAAYQYVTHPLYSGYGLERHDDAGLISFVDWNSYKYAMEDLGPVPAEPGSGLAEDTLIRLGVHLVERLASDGGWYRYPPWSIYIYPGGDSFTTSGRGLPVLAYLWAHLAVTDTGSGFVHHPGDHDEIYDQLQQTLAFLDPAAPEPTFADKRNGTGDDFLSYSLHYKEVLGNFSGAVINSHTEALHFASIMREAASLRGRPSDEADWLRVIDAYFPGTRQLFADLYPGQQDGQVYPGLINYSTSGQHIYNTDPSIDYPSITFEGLAAVYRDRGEYEIEFADVVNRYGRGDTFPFDGLFEPIEQVGLLNAMWRAFPPSLALSFSDEAPPRRFESSRWDSWTLHPHVHTLAGDFDGDGQTDALKLDVREDGGQSPAGRVWVGLAQDGGGFQTGGPWATWTTYANMKLAVGDFDGDGDDDLMKLDYPLGGGTALNGLWVGLSTGSSFVDDHWGDWETNSRTRLLAGDFNCDHRTDVMMVELRADGAQIPDGELRVALSTGSSFDTSQPPWALWTTHDRVRLDVGDFDGDGCDDVMKVDVASDGSTATSNLWVGLSRHQPGAPPLEGWSFQTGGPWGSWTTTGSTRFATGDFDGDGKTDVLKVDIGGSPGSNGLHVARSTGAGFSIRRWATWYTHERIALLTGDFDGNGKTDVMKLDVNPGGASARGGLWVGLSDGRELFTRQWDSWDTYPSMKVMAGDFDGDGIDDVLKADVSSPGSWLGLWVGLSHAATHDPVRASNPGTVGLAEIIRHGPGRVPTVHDPSLYIVERGGRQISPDQHADLHHLDPGLLGGETGVGADERADLSDRACPLPAPAAGPLRGRVHAGGLRPAHRADDRLLRRRLMDHPAGRLFRLRAPRARSRRQHLGRAALRRVRELRRLRPRRRARAALAGHLAPLALTARDQLGPVPVGFARGARSLAATGPAWWCTIRHLPSSRANRLVATSWPSLTSSVQVTNATSPRTCACGAEHSMAGAPDSKIAFQLAITRARPTSAGQPGWMQATGARRAHSASIAARLWPRNAS